MTLNFLLAFYSWRSILPPNKYRFRFSLWIPVIFSVTTSPNSRQGIETSDNLNISPYISLVLEPFTVFSKIIYISFILIASYNNGESWVLLDSFDTWLVKIVCGQLLLVLLDAAMQYNWCATNLGWLSSYHAAGYNGWLPRLVACPSCKICHCTIFQIIFGQAWYDRYSNIICVLI